MQGIHRFSHAVAYGRTEVVKWLKEEVDFLNTDKAEDLALDFIDWEEGDVDRKNVLGLFDDWY